MTDTSTQTTDFHHRVSTFPSRLCQRRAAGFASIPPIRPPHRRKVQNTHHVKTPRPFLHQPIVHIERERDSQTLHTSPASRGPEPTDPQTRVAPSASLDTHEIELSHWRRTTPGKWCTRAKRVKDVCLAGNGVRSKPYSIFYLYLRIGAPHDDEACACETVTALGICLVDEKFTPKASH